MGHESVEASETPLMLVSLGMKLSEKTSTKTITNAMKKTLVLLLTFLLSFSAVFQQGTLALKILSISSP
jgi:hypothetical protein